LQPNYHATLIREALNMPKNVARVDCRFQKALGFLLKYRNMAYPDAVGAAMEDGITHACLNDPQVMKEIDDGKETDVTYAFI
jgi:hypothetical protein